MYVLTYPFYYTGIRKDSAVLVRIHGVRIILVKKYVNILHNPYGDVYFIITDAFQEEGDGFETTLKPIFIYQHDKYNFFKIYGLRPIYERHNDNSLSLARDIDVARKEYAEKHGSMPKHYIGAYAFGFSHVCLCEEVSRDEALKIINDYEPLVLWEATK